MTILYNNVNSQEPKDEKIPQTETTNLSEISDDLSDFLDNLESSVATSSVATSSIATNPSDNDAKNFHDNNVSSFHENEAESCHGNESSDDDGCYAYPMETREELQRRYDRLHGYGINGMVVLARKFLTCQRKRKKSKK